MLWRAKDLKENKLISSYTASLKLPFLCLFKHYIFITVSAPCFRQFSNIAFEQVKLVEFSLQLLQASFLAV